MWAAEFEGYDVAEIADDVEPCDYPIEGEWELGFAHVIRCGKPSIDDGLVALCEEHLNADWPRGRRIEG